MRYIQTLLVILPLFLFTACSDRADIDYETDQAQDQMAPGTEAENLDTDINLQDEMAAIDRELEALESEISEGAQAADAEFEETVRELRERRDALATELEQAGDQTSDVAGTARNDIEQRLQELENDIAEARRNTGSSMDNAGQPMQNNTNNLNQ